MNKITIAALLFFSFSSHSFSATWKKVVTDDTTSLGTAGKVITESQCPENYIIIPALLPYAPHDFCIMKYEAKDDGHGAPVSKADGAPWTSINRDNARMKCRSLGHGYDLISNDQWQAIGRNIVNVASNWSTGTLYDGQLNIGHTDGAPSSALAASSDDNLACNLTGQSCSNVVWNAQRRTMKLSNNNIIWDFNGNAQEWITYDSAVSNGINYAVSQIRSGERIDMFTLDLSTHCSSWLSAPYCGFGSITTNSTLGGWARGSAYSSGVSGGMMSLTNLAISTSNAATGFRCVYAP